MRSGRIFPAPAANHDGKSITAVAVAAHEVGHALQDRDGYAPMQLRQKLIGYTIAIERTGSLLLMATPLVFAVLRSPAVLVAEVAAALAMLFSNVVIHAVTLPTEMDASFKRALSTLEALLPADDMPGAQRAAGGGVHLCGLGAGEPARYCTGAAHFALLAKPPASLL